MVQLVIMLVNGNLGTGVAIAGAFGLVRFRSAPGTAREISGVFLSMALGLATGMGYVGLAVVAFVILAAALALLTAVNFGQRSESERVLKITIPESLDYDGLFDDLFDQYTRSHTLERVKTANMGTLYELEYRVTLPGEQPSKEFLDALRCRNGNLNIVCGRPATREALKKANLTIDDMDLIEANEAFAAQSVAVARELGFDMDKVNVNGGAIAIGHPVGCSGARIIVTLLHEMAKRPDAKKGLATLCIGGGMGAAGVFELI